MSRLRLGTRRSALALWQAGWVKQRLEVLEPQVSVELVPMMTSGDQTHRRPTVSGGTKALFTKEIEEALLDGRIDLAVHSLKDMAAALPMGLAIGAVPHRDDPRDVLIASSGVPLARLPSGAVVGTSSLRRQAQLLHARPDLQVCAVRGNVPTRLRKLKEWGQGTGDRGQGAEGRRQKAKGREMRGERRASSLVPRPSSLVRLDAIVLALAGVRRLELEAEVTETLPPEVMLPAVGQGAIAVEVRDGDARVGVIVRRLDDATVRAAVEAERRFAATIGGGCDVPVAALAQVRDGRCRLQGRVLSPDGRRIVEDVVEGPAPRAEALGETLARRLLARGARALIGGTDARASS